LVQGIPASLKAEKFVSLLSLGLSERIVGRLSSLSVQQLRDDFTNKSGRSVWPKGPRVKMSA
jgi:hypothetical protein